MEKTAQSPGALCAGVIAPQLLFSGERTRPRVHISAPRRNASLVQPKKVVGEAPTTAREGACAPQTGRRKPPLHLGEGGGEGSGMLQPLLIDHAYTRSAGANDFADNRGAGGAVLFQNTFHFR
jgi:hypothetical protein